MPGALLNRDFLYGKPMVDFPMDMTLLCCCHDTPSLVPNLLRSLVQTGKFRPSVLVIDTSHGPECGEELQKFEIPHMTSRGTCHGEAVNLGLAAVQTPYVLLVDSDVLFLRDITPLVDSFVRGDCALLGERVGDAGGKTLYPRIVPWFCMLHRERLASYEIPFFDAQKTLLSRGSGSRVYDIGSTLLESVEKAGLVVKAETQLDGRYYRHYGGMSWRVQKFNPREGDTDVDFGGTHPRRDYYDWGLRVRAEYEKDARRFAGVEIEGCFS